jgi:hypothetical protein
MRTPAYAIQTLPTTQIDLPNNPFAHKCNVTALADHANELMSHDSQEVWAVPAQYLTVRGADRRDLDAYQTLVGRRGGHCTVRDKAGVFPVEYDGSQYDTSSHFFVISPDLVTAIEKALYRGNDKRA